MAEKRLLYAYKGNRCAHCGKTVEEVLGSFGTISQVFHFNHVKPEKKHPNYDNLIRRVISSEVLDEVDKCVMLCNFCHGILHGQDGKGMLTINSLIRGKRASQTIKGQIIIQFPLNETERPRISFFSDDEIKIIPYRVYIGGKRPKILTRGDLEKDNLLLKYMAKTKDGQPLSITNLNGQTLFHAQQADDEHLKATVRYCFSVLKANLCDDDSNPVIWVRNGMAIFKKGTIAQDGEYSCLVDYRELDEAVSD